MTAAQAASYPGGCTKLERSECEAASQPSAISQPGLHPGQDIGHLEVNLTVFRADTETPVSCRVTAERAHVDNGVAGSYEKVLETDAPQGKVVLALSSPAPSGQYQFRLTASNASGGPGFRSVSIVVQAYQPNGVPSVDEMIVVCPDGVNDLLCEIGEKQLYFSKVMRDQMRAWNIDPSNDHGMEYAVSTAHFFMSQIQVRNPILAKYWTDLSWAVTDLGIPPSDWQDFLKNYEQVMAIFNMIPWPSSNAAIAAQEASAEGTLHFVQDRGNVVQRLFKGCARGLPIYNGMSVGNYRLYSKTWSDYFPREDYKIRGDMAASYLLSIHMIFKCMADRLLAKVESLQKKLENIATIRLATALIFAPLTGGSMLTTLVSEGATYATSGWQNKTIVQGTKGVVAGVAKTVGIGAAAMGASLFAAGASLLISEIAKGANPAVQKIAQMIGPQVAEAASKDVLENVLGKGLVQGEGLLSIQGLGTAGAQLAVTALLSMITLAGVKSAKEFRKQVFQVENFVADCATPDPDGQLCAQITPFVLWCTEALMLAPFFDQVAAQAGIQDANTNTAIEESARIVEEAGVDVPASAVTPGASPPFFRTATGSAIAAGAGVGAGGLLALLLVGGLKS